jgi:hypothetical protein
MVPALPSRGERIPPFPPRAVGESGANDASAVLRPGHELHSHAARTELHPPHPIDTLECTDCALYVPRSLAEGIPRVPQVLRCLLFLIVALLLTLDELLVLVLLLHGVAPLVRGETTAPAATHPERPQCGGGRLLVP